MFSKFTEEAQKVLVNAKKEMTDLKHPYVGSEHLVLAILKEDNIITKKLKQYDIDYDKFKTELINIMGVGSNASHWFLYTPLLKRVIENAILDSKENNDGEVTTEHLFYSLLEEGEGVAIRILLGMNVDVDSLYHVFAKDNINRKIKKKKLLIEEMAIDLTKKAENNELDPVIGREQEAKRVIEILCRRTKNNPLLIGEAGVGKTAIVEHLSQLIVQDEVPMPLKAKRILSIDMATMVAGTKYRGEFEERLKKIISEIEENQDIIIFIDEIHTLVGAGGAEGAIDASNIFKPALARNKIRCIGATTTDEYKKFMEDDGALDRRFQKIYVEAPKEEMVKKILLKLKSIYEGYHQVSISEEIIDLIINLTEKYIYDRNQPDKAIDVLDEVCTKAALQETKETKKLNTLYKELEDIKDKKNKYIIDHAFTDAYQYRELEAQKLNEINNLELKMMKNYKIKTVTKENVAEVINNQTKIPIYEILNNNKKIFTKLGKELKNHIVGQNNAIKQLINITKRIKLGYRDAKKCYAYLFCGPTGIGKTELAVHYANNLVGIENVIKLDMSEFSEAHTVSKIIGAPPGYIGYEDNKNILEIIRDKPYSVLILDEIEKAHPAVINLFLQILDQAQIKDANGKNVRFDNVLILLTTNIGFKQVGFNIENEEKVISKLKQHFNIEFINRIHSVIVFNKLNKKDIAKITNNQINKMLKRFHNIDININPSVINEIVDLSLYKEFGARKIEKIILDNVESIIIDNIMKNNKTVTIETIKERV
ncbi:MAG: ATP-dependent Clp protease ATP-binding subunit [Bacilli bacterium]|jgi:ATP-dependent Clp protease ATP-binding subunit ClpC|nr:ATP-dependent Clp protease ATP-binding subunit [Bacilli bacterium]